MYPCFHCYFLSLSYVVLGLIGVCFVPPCPLGFVWVRGGLRRTSRNLCPVLCVNIMVGGKREWSLETWRLGGTFCSCPGPTSDCHAREAATAGLAGEFQWQPGESLAAPLFPVLLCKSRILWPLFRSSPSQRKIDGQVFICSLYNFECHQQIYFKLTVPMLHGPVRASRS